MNTMVPDTTNSTDSKNGHHDPRPLDTPAAERLNPQVSAVIGRRRFTAEYKRRILKGMA